MQNITTTFDSNLTREKGRMSVYPSVYICVCVCVYAFSEHNRVSSTEKMHRP